MGILTQEEIINAFDTMDKNKNGKLDKREFVKAIQFFAPEVSKRTLRAMFKFHDKDKSGFLDKKEFISLVRCLEAETYADDPFVILFRMCDVDKNNVLDLNEFIAVFRSINEDIDVEWISGLFKAVDEDVMEHLISMNIWKSLLLLRRNLVHNKFILILLSFFL